MPKIVKFSFQKGVIGTLEPRLMGDGYAEVLHNCDLRTGGVRPHKAPVLDGQAVPAGTVNLFEFLGSWYFGPVIRDWAAEKYGNSVRVYFTTPGQATVLPQKIIDGTQAQLGTKPPATAPTVTTYQSSSTSIITFTGATAAAQPLNNAFIKKIGNYKYRMLSRSSSGKVMARSTVVQVIVPGPQDNPTQYLVVLSYKIPLDASKTEVYRSDADSKSNDVYYLMDAVNRGLDGTGQVSDVGNLLDYARPFPPDSETLTPVKYFYTYVRTVNGHVDESGPSPLSEWIALGNGRNILFEANGAGSFTPDAAHTYNNPVATPVAGTRTLTVQSFISRGGTCTFNTASAHGLASGDMVRMTSIFPGPPPDPNLMYQVTVPSALDAPTGVTWTTYAAASATLNGTYSLQLVAVRGTNLEQVGARGIGAMSMPSPAQSITITTGNAFIGEVPPMNCDAYYAFINGVFAGMGNASDVQKDGILVGGGSTGWVSPPALPTTNKTATNVFEINETLVPMAARTSGGIYQPTWVPGFDVGAGVQIATVAHGYSVGSAHSVRLSGFTTNTALNAIWTATVTGTTTVKIKTSMSGSSETGTIAEFGSAAPGATTDETANITGRRLYRIGDVTQFLRVAEVAIEEPSFIDTVATVNLGNGPSSYYVENGIQVIFAPPPANLEKVVFHNGMLVGISGNQIRWTPVNAPDAWPEIFTMSPGSQPMNLASNGGSVIVLCLDHIGRLEMISPTQVLYQKSLAEQGCTAPYSVCKTMRGIVYLSAEGLMMFDAAANGSWPIFQNRLIRNFFLAPSVPTTPYGHWWTPANKSFGYNFLSRDLPGAKRAGMAAQFDTRPTIPNPFLSPRGFYANGRYYLYYSGESYASPAVNANYSHHAMLEVDLRTPEPVGTFHGLRPMAAWVTEVGNPYLMLPGATSGDGVSSLATSIALAGSTPDTDGGMGGALSSGTPKLFRFLDEAGTRSRIEIRTGPIGAILNDRVRWHYIDVHGVGSGTLKVYVDGWDATAGGAAAFVASQTPSQARRVNLPNGAAGYTLDLELAGDLNLVCCEVCFSPLEGEVE